MRHSIPIPAPRVCWLALAGAFAAAALLGFAPLTAHALNSMTTIDRKHGVVVTDMNDLRVENKGKFLRITGERTVLTNTGTFRTNSVILDIPTEAPQDLTVQELEPPGIPNAGGSGRAIGGDPLCVVGLRDNGFFTPFHAFRWTPASGSVDLGTLDPANNTSRSSSASDASSDCSVVVGTSDASVGVQRAFRWTAAGGMVDLGAPAGAGRSSRASGVSGNGDVVVGEGDFADASTISGFRRSAFRWTAATGFHDLGALAPGFQSLAAAVSRDGAVVVGQGGVEVRVGNTSTNGSRAFRWTQSLGMQPIGPLPAHTHAAATALSDNGKIVVGTSSESPLPGDKGRIGLDTERSRAFRWTEAIGVQDLRQVLVDAGVDMTGITLVSATGISPDGQWIIGAAKTPATGPNEVVAYVVQVCDDAIGGACETGGSGGPAPGFSVAASSAAGLTVAAGQSATTTLSVTPSGGFAQPVSFACSGLPTGASCSFSPATVTPAGGAVTTTLTITTDGSAVAMLLRGGPASTIAYALGPMAFITSGVIARRRRSGDRQRWAWAGLLAAVLLVLMAACGGGGGADGGAPGGPAPGGGSNPPASTGTPAGTSNVTVTATSGSGASAVSSTITIPLTVTR